jgi:hypothetical protein
MEAGGGEEEDCGERFEGVGLGMGLVGSIGGGGEEMGGEGEGCCRGGVGY